MPRRTFSNRIPIPVLTAFLERAAKAGKLRYAIILANYAKRDDNGVWAVSIGIRQLAKEVDGKVTDTTKSAASRALKDLMECNALYLVSKGETRKTRDGEKRVASVYAINMSTGADLHSEMHPLKGAKKRKKRGETGADLHSEMHQSFSDKQSEKEKDEKTENATFDVERRCPDCGAVIIVTANHETDMLTFTCPLCGELGCRPIG